MRMTIRRQTSLQDPERMPHTSTITKSSTLGPHPHPVQRRSSLLALLHFAFAAPASSTTAFLPEGASRTTQTAGAVPRIFENCDDLSDLVPGVPSVHRMTELGRRQLGGHQLPGNENKRNDDHLLSNQTTMLNSTTPFDWDLDFLLTHYSDALFWAEVEATSSDTGTSDEEERLQSRQNGDSPHESSSEEESGSAIGVETDHRHQSNKTRKTTATSRKSTGRSSPADDSGGEGAASNNNTGAGVDFVGVSLKETIRSGNYRFHEDNARHFIPDREELWRPFVEYLKKLFRQNPYIDTTGPNRLNLQPRTMPPKYFTKWLARPDVFPTFEIWLASKEKTTLMHTDIENSTHGFGGLLLHLSGQKRVFLYSQDQDEYFDGLSRHDDGYKVVAGLDPSQADEELAEFFPKYVARRAQRRVAEQDGNSSAVVVDPRANNSTSDTSVSVDNIFEAVVDLQPYDILYIPTGFWHFVSYLSDGLSYAYFMYFDKIFEPGGDEAEEEEVEGASSTSSDTSTAVEVEPDAILV
ncbi:unnamed protein product [Amoebophrya sp. A120]|nr:unnamed protein product [Amoebophrya sp. A120]|eukprot:GSA120T00026276001.1